MFIVLGAEYIVLYAGDTRHVVPFRDVELHLSELLVSNYKKFLPDRIYVLNGPGSFTNLRVGALALNTLSVLDPRVSMSTTHKIDLYGSLVEQHVLPATGILFIGQRKNIWKYDFGSHTYIVYPKTDYEDYLSHSSQNGLFVDCFIGEDFPMLSDHEDMIEFDYQDGSVWIRYKGTRFDITSYFSPTTSIEPYYGMEPNIG